jgi:hypothetical protein
VVAIASDVVCGAVSVLVVLSTLLRFVFGLSSDLAKPSPSVSLAVEADGAEYGGASTATGSSSLSSSLDLRLPDWSAVLSSGEFSLDLLFVRACLLLCAGSSSRFSTSSWLRFRCNLARAFSGSGWEVAAWGALLMVAFLSLSLRGRSPPSVSETCDSFGEVGMLVAVMLAGKGCCVRNEELQSPDADPRREVGR